MKLQHKAWLLIFSTISVLTAASTLISQRSISNSFADLERDQFHVESERASRLLDQQLKGLTVTLTDYAYWDETVAYIHGTRPDYFTENFGPDNMQNLGLTHYLLLDALGLPLAGAERVEDATLQPMPGAMSQVLRSLAVAVLSDKNSKTVISTYRRLGDHLYLIAIAPIRPQFVPNSAPKGALAVVRRFDAAELARFSDVLMHPVRLSFSAPDASGASGIQISDDQSKARSSAPVLDHEGRPAAHLVVELDRDLHHAGRALAWAGALQVALAGLVVGAALVLLLDHFVLRRLQRTHRELDDVTKQGMSERGLLSVYGEDELADLARGVNDLLAKTREDAAQQKEAHKRQEALHLQLMQSQKTEAIGRFTSGIAHDFNNSLAAISGWVRLAHEDLSPGHPSVESLEQASKSIRYASGLMKQLLSFSRQSAPLLERIRLGALVQDASSLVSLGLMRRCTLHIDRQTSDDWIEADSTQMKQVIVNLLINACDAMNGEGAVTICLQSQEAREGAGEADSALFHQLPAGRYLTLSIQDEGPGIPTEHIDRIFDPFFTTKAADKGTGLGLSVVHGIMARHGGAVRVSNTQGHGACFVLVLPAREDAECKTPAQPADASAPRQLLYAEDDAMVRDAWCALLERRGWVVTPARDGEEAWQRYQTRVDRWGAVLTDLSMPRMTGVELAQRIRASGSSAPVVLMSGQIPVEYSGQLEAAGFSAVLRKPVDEAELLRALEEASAQAPGAPTS